MPKIRPFLLALAALFVSAGPAAAGTLVIAAGSWVGDGPLYLARDLGFFAKRGLSVTFVPSDQQGGTTIGALAAGRIDGLTSTLDMIVKFPAAAACWRIVMARDESYGGDGILVPPDVTGLKQLAGRRVALEEGSVSEFWLDYLLTRAGMKPSDVTIVDMRPDDAAAAFAAGRVPIAVTWEPSLSLARDAGHGKLLVDSRSTPGIIAGVVVVSCAAIRQRPEDVRALVGGILEGIAWFEAHKEAAYPIMHEYVAGFLAPGPFAAAYREVRYYDLARNRRYLGTPAAPGEIDRVLQAIRQTWGSSPLWGRAVTENTYPRIVDSRFLP